MYSLIASLGLVIFSALSFAGEVPTIRQDFCACKNQKSLIENRCELFCRTKKTAGADKLYLTFQHPSTVEWCFDGTQNPTCVLHSEEFAFYVKFTTANSAEVDISSLPADKLYQLSLLKLNSTDEGTNSIQLTKKN
jgi:hypothetical protein